MKIQELLQRYGASSQVGALAKVLGEKEVKTIFLEGLLCSSAPMVFASLSQRKGNGSDSLLFILQDADEAGYFYHDLVQLLGDRQVLFLPSSYRRAVKYGQRDAASEILRTEVLSRLSSLPSSSTSHLYIVSYPEAVAELVVSKKQFDDRTLILQQGDSIDVDQTAQQLRDLGFQEVDYVYEPGQFALRGSILDVYSYSSELPFRIDLFGDDIDSIRTFEVETQLSKDKCQQVSIVPEMAVIEEKVPFLSFLPDDTTVVFRNFQFVCDSVARIYEEGFSQQALTERLEGATEQEQHDIMLEMKKEAQLVSGQQFLRDVLRFRHVILRADKEAESRDERTATIRFDISPQPQFHKNFELLQQSLNQYLDAGYQLCILADSKKQLERLRDIFSGESDRVEISGERGAVLFDAVEKTLHEGFADNSLKLCVFTDHQIFDRFHKYSLRSDRARGGKVALTLKEIQQFEIGDYVVHIDHGVGKFGGLVRMPQGDGYQEMIKIIYDGGGSIYVSIHSLYKVSKYKAQDGGQPPRLSHLGTGQWERMKERTKAKLKDIARDLIKLYAARRRERGFAFSADTFMQQELEASFLYEDTPDQAKATADLKHDMESPRPMDRLICGDVGFGKTELAMRAAFKAATDGKQVAVLVPTTVLALQHYNSFSERFQQFPVRVEYLSRAKTAKQTQTILEDLAAGKIDVIIGTHKLVGKGVKFKDLGLLIIDEEQKFGVATKEKLRGLKVNVDTLTLTATPIPRTLQFSLLGARDLSIMTTPPQNRYPIQTEVITPADQDILKEAIELELGRNGQVFYIHNRVATLDMVAHQLQKLVPEARIVVANGQMPPEQVEEILTDFINYDYDILVSTSIIENGVDIPNVNTIIIGGAHHFGLSDLHQMRGRVGRSNRKAYCYLVAPSSELLTPEARRRLNALEAFSELGSGFNLAMQDLDIRGAGNLLGAEQSGFIADLGYETYQRILQEAVLELKEEEFQDLFEEEEADETRQTAYVTDSQLDSDLEIGFPQDYIENISERITLYRELDSIQNEQALLAFKEKLVDRFGQLPEQGEELLQVVRLRWLCIRLGIEKIVLKQERMVLYFPSNNHSPYYQSEAFGKILRFVVARPKKCQFRETPIREGLPDKRRSVIIDQVRTVNGAFNLLSKIEQMDN